MAILMPRLRGMYLNKFHALDTSQASPGTCEIEATVETQVSTVQIARFHETAECERVVSVEHGYVFDLSLTGRPADARACYMRHWRPERFERIGDLFVMPPGETVRIRAGASVMNYMTCLVKTTALEQYCEKPICWSEPARMAALDMPNPRPRLLMQRMAEELRSPALGTSLLIELMSAELAIELMRFSWLAGHEKKPGELPAWRLRLVDDRLKDEDGLSSLSELAALCKLSVRQLTRGFRASRGYTLGEAITRERLRRAKIALRDGKSVKSVSLDLGFSSPSGFSQAFRKETGMTPKLYRDCFSSKCN